MNASNNQAIASITLHITLTQQTQQPHTLTPTHTQQSSTNLVVLLAVILFFFFPSFETTISFKQASIYL
jgi:hypothetical protein